LPAQVEAKEAFDTEAHVALRAELLGGGGSARAEHSKAEQERRAQADARSRTDLVG
jgi:hypothetical protein